MSKEVIDEPRREFTLSDGRKADIIEPQKGKHLRKAARMTAGINSPTQFDGYVAMVCIRCRIEGEKIVPAEIDEMDGDIVGDLIGEVLGQSAAAKAAKEARTGKAKTEATTATTATTSPDGTSSSSNDT